MTAPLDLPELPEPDTASLSYSGRSVDYIDGYEAGFESAVDKMRSYARQAVLAERERADVYRIERDGARTQRDSLLTILVGIHALLPPKPIEVDGKAYVFNDPDANATLRKLSERINAIEEQAAAAIRDINTD